MADPNVQKTSSRASVVHSQQYYQGIPIFQMALTVHFSDRKQLRSATGDNVSIGDGFNVIPSFGVKEAILEVCNYLNANQGLSDAGDQVDGWGQPVKVTPIDVSSSSRPTSKKPTATSRISVSCFRPKTPTSCCSPRRIRAHSSTSCRTDAPRCNAWPSWPSSPRSNLGAC